MRSTLRSLCLALPVAIGTGLSALAEEPADPVKLVRTLELLQDSIAHGTGAPEDARRKLIDVVGNSFLSADPTIWNDRRNADAALRYVLNGGNPVVLAQLPKREDDEARARLVAAVIAYAAGSRAEAMRLWDDIELASLPDGLVGPAALTRANLLMDQDPERAMRFADIARLELPGTLVEEAATRRGIEIASKLGDSERFRFYTVSYVTRFPRSPYGPAFRQLFSQSYLGLASRRSIGEAPALEEILAVVPPEERVEIYLEVARLAVIGAEMTLAKTAAESAADLSSSDTIEMRRAELYREAANAFVGDPVAARDRLEVLSSQNVPKGDRELLTAVRSVVDQIQRWPAADGAEEPPAADGDLAEGSPIPIDDITRRAQAALLAVDRVLEEAEL